MNWRTEADGHMPGFGHLPRRVKYAIQAFQPNGNHWDVEPRRHHADSWTKRLNFSMTRPFAFGKNQDREAIVDEIACVSQCLPRAGFTLRQRERVEKCRGEPVVEAVGEPLLARVLLRE